MTRLDPIDAWPGAAEPAPLGPYSIDLTFYRSDDPMADPFALRIDADRLPMLGDSLRSALDDIARRRINDALCGDCATCGNVRMVNDPPKHMPPGSDWQVACPRCGPLIEAARGRGLVPR